jgi:hypothetical protein
VEPADSSLASFLERRQWVIQLDEYQREPELYGDLILPDWLREMRQAWLVTPLLLGEHLQGFLVLFESRARPSINWEDRDLIKTAVARSRAMLRCWRPAKRWAKRGSLKRFTGCQPMSCMI